MPRLRLQTPAKFPISKLPGSGKNGKRGEAEGMESVQSAATSVKFPVARMEPRPRPKLYTMGNRLDNPK